MEKSKPHLDEILVYKLQIALTEAFQTSSSAIQSKTTFLYYQPSSRKIVEVPYSPSMGESPERMLWDCELVRRNLTWFDFDFLQLQHPKNFSRSVIYTYGIGQDLRAQTGQLLKLKANKQMIPDLIEWSRRFANEGISWLVDFNQGLNVRDLEKFLCSVNLKTCFGIEQPLPKGTITAEICKFAPIILDEEMPGLDFNKLLHLRPKAVVLKPWRYTWLEYRKWHNFLLEEDVPYLVGSMIQGPVADHLCDTLNQGASIQYDEHPKSFDVEAILAEAKLVGVLNILD